MSDSNSTAVATRQAVQAPKAVPVVRLDEAHEPALLAVAGYPETAKALSVAQQKCRAVEKDATNKYHNFRYASAEAVITEAKAALADSGLALVCQAPRMRITAVGQAVCYQMYRRLYLLHGSGECLPLDEIEWPVVEERGRPLDKAYAIAITTSLAYFLRDLLMMPRVQPDDDAAAQEDRPQQQGRQQPGNEQAAPAAPAQQTAPRQPPMDEPVTEDQANTLELYMEQLKLSEEDVASRLVKLGFAGDRRKLTRDQAGRVLNMMRARLQQPTGGAS